MLLKSLCSNCGHSFLAESGLADMVECPRCHFRGEATPPATNGPGSYAGPEDPLLDALGGDPMARGTSFDPAAPPPMFVSRDRLVRGMIFGAVTCCGLGVALGAALAAVGVALPAVVAVSLGLTAAMGCRYGFGGRSIRRTRGRAMATAALVASLGLVAFVAGGWIVERLTSTRASVTREDLAAGLESLVRKRGRTTDASSQILLDQRIVEVERLRRRTDAQMEDYLWMQEAQLVQPLLAYGKLRVLRGPVVRLGPDSDPAELPRPVTAGLFGVEWLLAVFLAVRGVLAAHDR